MAAALGSNGGRVGAAAGLAAGDSLKGPGMLLDLLELGLGFEDPVLQDAVRGAASASASGTGARESSETTTTTTTATARSK